MKKHLLILLCTLVACLAPQVSLADSNLFPEGSCEILTQNGLPEGFLFPNKLDKPWLGGNNEEVLSEEGNNFVRFVNSQQFPYFHSIKINLPIPEGAVNIRVSGRFRCDFVPAEVQPDWQGYKIHLVFGTMEPTDPLGDLSDALADVPIISIQNPMPDWTEKEGSAAVPVGAKVVQVRIMLNGFVGQFDFDDIRVEVD